MLALLLFIICSSILVLSKSSSATASAKNKLLSIKGGLVPQADKVGDEYYEKYELDYGKKDTKRFAGSLRGFIDIHKLKGLQEKDPFLKWWNKHLEEGPSEVTGRLKPIYVSYYILNLCVKFILFLLIIVHRPLILEAKQI